MRIGKALTVAKLARSGAEAARLVKQGAISIGGCKPECSFFDTGGCDCGGWEKVTDPLREIEAGVCIKVGKGFYRLVNRLDGAGWDQVNGIGRVPQD
jgi:hypothetical protein